MNKKGQLNLNSKIEAGAIIVIIIVILFSIYSSLIPEAQTASDKLNVSNRCSAVGCFYNATDANNTANDCRENSSIISFGCPNSLGQGIPLSGLFGRSGIVFLLIMVGLLLTILRTVMPKGKK